MRKSSNFRILPTDSPTAAQLYYKRDRQTFLNRVRPVIEEIKKSGVKTLSEIALCLTRRGIPTRNGKSVWFGSTVKTVIG